MSSGTTNDLSDEHLIEKILSGDTHAFEAVIQNTERLVAQIIFKMVNNIEDRKDIAQDVYLKVFKNLSTFKFQAKLSTWIGQITYNTCLNYIERKKLILIEPLHNENETNEETLESISNKMTDIFSNKTEEIIFKKELSGILSDEINQLLPLYKTLITLYHNEELSYTEIGQITQLPEGTVKNYLFRARKTIQKNILLKI